MNYTMLVVLGIFVNTFLAVLFPTQVGLDDPFGIDNIRQQQFSNFDSQTQSYFVEQGVFNPDGTPGKNFETYQSLQTAGQSDDRVILTDLGFGFTDYLAIAWNGFISIGIFLLAFSIIIFQLPLSVSIFIAPIVTTLSIYSLVRFIVGR